ncbi:hypothetical protein PO909_018599, partial [Leuciscus waleckii]
CLSTGNLGRVDYISEFEFDLFIRPDTCNPRFRVWFNFTVENVRETQVSPDQQRLLTKAFHCADRQYPLMSSGLCHWWRGVVTCHSDMWEQRACPPDRPAGWAGLQLFSFVNAGRSKSHHGCHFCLIARGRFTPRKEGRKEGMHAISLILDTYTQGLYILRTI